MKQVRLLFMLVTLLPFTMNANIKDTSAVIIDLERSALERWNQGDPDGFIEISDPDVVYFDPFREHRVNGIEELKALYDSIRGMVKVDTYEMIDPKVQTSESMAVLTYNLISQSGERTSRWNCTEVFRLNEQGDWKLIQTHWSFTKPEFAPKS